MTLKSNKKTRSDKCPLTLHKTGQYCKKIRSKICYFGTDKKMAVARYLEQATYLHAGELPRQRTSGDPMSLSNALKSIREDRDTHYEKDY